MARPRLCAPLPPLPAAEEVRLSRHAVERFILRVIGRGARVRYRSAEESLRAAVLAGEVVRVCPDGFGTRRFERREGLVGYVVCCRGEVQLVLPVRTVGAGFVATTTLARR